MLRFGWALVFIVASFYAVFAFRDIAVGDIDAITYIEGAHSLQAGSGYRLVSGEPIVTWPPGYSAILSVIPAHPLVSAAVVNGLAFAVASTALFLLAMRFGWRLWPAAAVTVVFSAGLLREVAVFAKPDILTFAVFFVGLGLYLSASSAWGRVSILLAMSAAIWIKFLFLVVVPAFLAGRCFESWRRGKLRQELGETVVSLLGWGAALAGVMLFNIGRAGEAIPADHRAASLFGFAAELGELAFSICRGFLFAWYGSVRSPILLATFGLALTLAALTLSRLRYRPQNRQVFVTGFVVIALLIGLLMIRRYDAQARTFGYGLVLLILACPGSFGIDRRPLPGRLAWIGQAALGGWVALLAATALANPILVESRGLNYPRYAALADAALASGRLPKTILASNAFHLLDVHSAVATRHENAFPVERSERHYLRVDLPNFDAIMRPIPTPPSVPPGWVADVEFDGATLYVRSEHSGGGTPPIH
jgi:hypothetical protein